MNKPAPHYPEQKASLSALALALLVNAVLIGALFLNMQWQQPKPAEVELWDGASLQAALDGQPPAEPTQPTINTNEAKPIEEALTEVTPDEIETKSANKPNTLTTEKKPEPTQKPKTAQEASINKPVTKTNTNSSTKTNNANQSSVLNSIKNGSGGGAGEDTSGYKAAVKRQVENSARSLKGKSAVVFVSLTASGVIQSKRIAKTSGDAAWDAKLLSAIGSRLPPNVPKSLQSGFTLTIRP